ncbi:MAG TPA: DUF2071 domain-containing protein [Thermoanaerobaculia bacterium]|nr:DUF2071 domain-containing protein [Thermoanaerobaculia bacterium]
MSAPPFTPVLRQDWRDLLFLHWSADPEILRRRLPDALELDTFDGTAYLGLTPFRLENARPAGVPALPGLGALGTFGEVNLRTYVRPRAEPTSRGGGEPGVWFFSLDAASLPAVLGARAAYRLPYFDADIEVERTGSRVRFASRRRGRPGHCRVVWHAGGDPTPSVPESLEEFLVERYVLYTASGGALWRARVAHEPYPVAAARVESLDQDLVEQAGLAVAGEPLVHWSPGVDPAVSAPERLG